MATVQDIQAMARRNAQIIKQTVNKQKAENQKAKESGYYTYKMGGKVYTVKPASAGGYMDAYKQYASDAKASKDLYKKQMKKNQANLKNTLTQNNATTNANYDNSARQAYVDYMRKQKALPSQLESLGVNGGASESGLLNLYNNYGVTHAANEQQRMADLTTNRQAYDSAMNQLASDYNQYLMDYKKDLATQRQTALNNQMNEYNNEITRFSSSVAQYPTTEKGYESYKKWIAKLKKSNDPLKSVKIGLVRQQMATQFPDGKPESAASGGSSGGGGGGGYRRRSGGGGGGYAGNSENTTQPQGYTGNSRSAYEQRFKSSSKKKSNTKTRSIKGDTYRITSKGSYRQR